MSGAESDRPRAAWVGPLLIAVVLLAVIGGVVGFVLGTGGEKPDGVKTAATGPSLTPDPDPTGETDPTPYEEVTSAPQQPVRTTAAAAGGHERPTTCPEHTVRLAGAYAKFSLLLYLRTDKSEVWICADEYGTLYYQGHSGRPGEKLVEGENALFLNSISRTDDGYVAVNTVGDKTTRYLVSRQKLIIEYPDGRRDTQPAI